MSLNIAIGIATAGRRDGLTETVAYLGHQTRPADAVYICPASDGDFEPGVGQGLDVPVHIVRGGRGLTTQRNVIIRAAREADIIVFFDDDFVPESTYLEELERLFEHRPGLVIATGEVMADGATTEGIAFDEAVYLVETAGPLPDEALKPVHNGYGCNMAVRRDVIVHKNVFFDETLPLYGWWEDVDFSRRLARYGDILHANRLRGVHMGSKSGRTPGKRLGYAQVINIVYMMKKGSVTVPVGTTRIARNVAANLVRQFSPEPWVDRAGRFRGNLMALGDSLRGDVDPQRILSL